MRTRIRLFSVRRYWVLAVGLLIAWSATAQSVKPSAKPSPLVLPVEPLPFTPQTYYLADLLDERKERQAVAYLLPAIKNPDPSAKPVPIDLQGGAIPAIRSFITQSWASKARLHPLVVRLQECKVTESLVDQGRVEGRISVAMAFDIKLPEETIHLVDYHGGARYNRPMSQAMNVAPALRQSLVDALQFLDTWMNQHTKTDEKLAQSIQVHWVDYTENTEPDTVFYTPNRPLTWGDFRAVPRKANPYAASVFPSFSYEGHSKVIDGVIHLTVTTKVFVLPTSSWVREGARDTYGLNHEQRHFDLVKLVVERFKQKIHPDSLTTRHYDSIIQYQYIESFREMNRVQDAYDKETRHGLDQAAQQRWNQRIDEELRSFGITKP